MKNQLLTLGLFLACLCFFALKTQAQDVMITGKVTDENGEPLPGVTVLVGGTSIGTISDLDGNYRIGVANPSNAELIFSFVGYASKRIALDGSKTTYDVSLESDILNLDEVVVTGTSTITNRKKVLGNSVSSVKAKDIEHTASENPLAAISGRVMGAQVTQNQGNPGGGFSVRLRGISTINGSSEPLYIVDGVIVDNSSTNVINLNADAMGTNFDAGQNRLVDLNPDDIERIEVTNGAAAAAIYGSRASNGVVQIFTKRGSEGKPRVTFSTAISVSELRKRLEFNDFPERFGFRQDPRLFGVGDRLTTIADLRSADDRAAVPGTGPPALAGRPLVENTYSVERFDYQDNIFQTGIGTDNYVSVSGGSGNTKYFGSASFSRNEGIIKNTSFRKFGSRVRIDHRFSDLIKISTGLTYNNSFSNDKPNGNNFFSPISTMMIIDNVWDITERDEDGNLMHVERVRVNPLSVIETYDITQETNRIIADLQTSIFPFKGFSLDHVLGIDTYSLEGNTFQPPLPYPEVSTAFFPDGYAAVANSNVFLINNDVTATYQMDITTRITSTTTAGFQWQYDKTNFNAIEGRELTPFVTNTNAIGNFFRNPRQTQTERSIFGYFLQQTFGINDLLFITAAGRIDGASSFGEDQRDQKFGKISGSFVLSDLDFWKNADLSSFWNVIKLRASFGEAGNLTGINAFDRFTNFQPVTTTGRTGFLVEGDLGSANARLGNPEIEPEVMTEVEFGADLAFLDGRTGIQFTYYHQDIDKLILERSIAPTLGGSSVITNIGSMENKGIELMVDIVPIRNADLQWNTTFLVNTFDNEVSNIGQGRAGVLLRGGGGTQSAIDGQPLGAFFGNFFARNPDGSLLLSEIGLPQIERGDDITGEIMRDADGQPTGDPLRKVLGDPNPDWTGSFINDVSFKKISARIQFDAIQGFDVWNWNTVTGNNVGNGPLAEQELRGEVPRGWVAAIGGFIGPRIQEVHVEDGSFIKLREIALTYDFGKVNLFENLKFSFVGRNIWSIDDYSGYDPETNSAGQSNRVRGDDFGNVPIPRLFKMKLTATL